MSSIERRNLVICRAGRRSLHTTWLDDAATRTWDLYLCPYQDVAPGQPDGGVVIGDVIPGPKWSGLRQLMRDWNGWRDYDRVWLPDDDLFATQGTIDRMFELADALSFDLCAPALHEASYYAHFSTMRNRRCVARHTGFVEIMAPCFSKRALDGLLPTLELTTTGWGWGLDSLWPKLLDYRHVGVIDAAPVLHTRAVGAFRDEALGRRVHEESDRIMASHDCGQVHTTYAAFDRTLRSMDLSSDALNVLLVDGWRYLLDANPRALAWIMAFQQPREGWPSYPVAGTPAGGPPMAGGRS
ncbi:DUF707 domain-containing protein [Bordetella genomosp. 9]|uniref:DUF707 domain-containing protein n=1 Tax=Bordetella genomosp. 9 TaxID=1416803 RepID=A0A1W6YWP2_9BORD|nr:DUF707 domain-containing protein [Bordetella genomosp. 9]ARP85329.1 hypothetical protein CAL13_03180 [Bordetella genomosp. 9]